jgi:hypothetical protein
LRNEALTFEIGAECACCGAPIHLTMRNAGGPDAATRSQDTCTVAEADCRPMVFMPIVDFTKLKAPSIIDDF